MVFFGIINIPLFKYFCDLPGFNYVDESHIFDIVSSKFYTVDHLFSTAETCSNLFDFCIGTSSFCYSAFIFSSYIYYMFFYFFYISTYIDVFFFPSDYIEVIFQTSTSNFNFIEFCTLQRFIYVIPNETHLIFFRMYNTINFDVSGISIYLLYPTDYLVYFNKIQCFCFEELLLYPYESIDLPVIFYISSDILNYVDFFYSNKLYLSYLFLVR
jgi:cytochrome c oxidase assembly protein Cox11